MLPHDPSTSIYKIASCVVATLLIIGWTYFKLPYPLAYCVFVSLLWGSYIGYTIHKSSNVPKAES